jgi:hypothetical protein
MELPGGVSVVFSDRGDGNMSSVGGEGARDGARNRERLRERIGVGSLARGFQVHGTHVARVQREREDPADNESLEQADGQATSLAGVGVMVMSADCVPVAIACEGARVVLHAGWRGLAAGVLEQGVLALRALEGRGEMVAAIGPCARACCYEVGAEVHAALGTGVLRKANIDLCAIAHTRLRDAGVGEISDLQICTICDEDYFSHRREGERAGRMAAVAWSS